jgi:acyl dehydratase
VTDIGPDLVGVALAPVAWRWDDRDVMMYALGIGARLPEDLAYVYEGLTGDGPRVAATFPLAAVTLTLPPLVAALGIDLRALLHASQAIELHRVAAPSGAGTVTRTITGVWDKGRAALVDCEDVVEDGGDGPLATARSTWWITGAGGFGGPRSAPGAAATPAPAPAAPAAVPDAREPDLRHTLRTTAEQAALHRLSGDRNPVHIDPAMARAAGQPRPFLHGLCTMGALGHRLDRAAQAHGRRLTSLAGRFTRPAFPGDALELAAWWDDPVAPARAIATVAVGADLVFGPAAATFAGA